MDGTPTIPESEAVAQFEPNTKRFEDLVRRFSGDAEITVLKSVNSIPGAADRLREEGYESGAWKMVSSGGRKYKLTHWIKTESEFDNTTYGTASARVSIRSGADIDFENAIFDGMFEPTGPIAFELDDLPEDPDRRKKAMALFGKFRARVVEQYMTIIDKLDLEIQLLKRKDRTILRGKAAGETYRYNKIIMLDWFDEEKVVNLLIAATPLGEPEGLPGRPMLGEEEVWNPAEDEDSNW